MGPTNTILFIGTRANQKFIEDIGMTAKSKSAHKSNGIKFIKGTTDILIIAPHGVRGKGIRKATNTDILAKMIAKNLKCSALINDRIRRSECKYNSIADATKDKKFISEIRRVLNARGSTIVIWLHVKRIGVTH